MAEGAEVEGDDSIKSLASSVIPARKVPVCDCNIPVRKIWSLSLNGLCVYTSFHFQ